MAEATNIDLSPTFIRALCKGDTKNLPVLWVHDNAVWPTDEIRIDTKNRLHMRRWIFENVVAPAIPCREGMWLRVDVQEFFIDLRPDQLDGDPEQNAPLLQADRRKVVLADDSARIPGDDGYGESDVAAVRAPADPKALPRTLGESAAQAPGAVPGGYKH